MTKFYISVFRNELKSLTRQLPAAFWVLFFPTLLFLTLWLAYPDKENAKLALVVNDHTATQSFERSLGGILQREKLGHRVFIDKPNVSHEGLVAIAIDVPPCAGKDHDESECSIAIKPAANSAADVPNGLLLWVAAIAREAARPDAQLVATVRTSIPEGAPSLSHVQFLLSGVIILALLSAGINVTSAAIVIARDRNVFRSMSRFPISPGHYLTLMVLARATAGGGAVLLLLLFGTIGLGVRIESIAVAVPFTLLVSLVGGLVFSGVGMMLAGFFRSESSVSLAGTVLYLPTLFLGNLTFPVQATNAGSRRLMELNPASFLVEWLRHGLFLGEYWPPTFVGLAGLVVAAIAMHWLARRQAVLGLVQVG